MALDKITTKDNWSGGDILNTFVVGASYADGIEFKIPQQELEVIMNSSTKTVLSCITLASDRENLKNSLTNIKNIIAQSLDQLSMLSAANDKAAAFLSVEIQSLTTDPTSDVKVINMILPPDMLIKDTEPDGLNFIIPKATKESLQYSSQSSELWYRYGMCYNYKNSIKKRRESIVLIYKKVVELIYILTNI